MDEHWVLVIWSDLLQSSCSFLWNMGNSISSQFYSHLLMMWQFFKCFHTFFCHFSLTEQKSFDHQSWCCSLLFPPSEENILCPLFWLHYPQVITKGFCFTSSKLGSILDTPNTCFVSLLILLIDICSWWSSFSRLFYIRRNKNQVDSIETGLRVIVHLLP